MVDNRLHYSRKGIPVLCPMYLYDENGNATPNINQQELMRFCENLNGEMCPKTFATETVNVSVMFQITGNMLYSLSRRTSSREIFSSCTISSSPRSGFLVNSILVAMGIIGREESPFHRPHFMSESR